MEMQPLTTRQRAIYEFIADEIRVKGVAPSLAEIGQRFSLSALATVHKHLTNLEQRGYITRRWNRARAITLVFQADACPTCGQMRPATERASRFWEFVFRGWFYCEFRD